ncbi:PIG-L deacetylase family protein [Promethearchaeum syntrophicum]|uniref:PIG-L deacetylase family protein n=1 Tax=Promethearchaeum syntrophicum TaxID=2594042 RepID=A0A5B9DD21_9ARCH|nr:PIG-L family deacetylase [Candidatus Prometheoarchaeum syntrophicum]QEE16670.1 Diacetylchitobiose deacetylase [Candidatus Prometheoarchaeum syntrophicum]
MKKPKILFVNPHPDDGEAFCANLCIQAVKYGWRVHQVLATCDEYGTPRAEFKGKRIQRIRRSEMVKAAESYGVNQKGIAHVKLHWMNYIDGYVPYNKEAINRLMKFILKLNPDVIIGPDPFIYMDGHVDHMAVGRNYYFALKGMNPNQRPKRMLFFQTLSPDFFIPINISDKRKVKKVRRAHLSQWNSFEIKLLNFFPTFLQLPSRLKKGILKKQEGYRIVLFDNEDHLPKGITKIIFKFFKDKAIGCEEGRLLPKPEHLGLIRVPEGEII